MAQKRVFNELRGTYSTIEVPDEPSVPTKQVRVQNELSGSYELVDVPLTQDEIDAKKASKKVGKKKKPK